MSAAANAKPKPRPGREGIGAVAATALVVGNMVGVGVFTSLGWQLLSVPTGFPVLLLWVIGGLYALCGALCYAELVSALPRCGGEYHLLGAVYHPAAGFLAGWVSLVAGFAAPVAVAAGLFGGYLGEAFGWPPTGLALGVLAAVTAVHVWRLRLSGGFQVAATALKFALVGGLAVAGLCHIGGGTVSLAPQPGDLAIVLGAPFAVSLFYVNYAFAGWNAAAYVAGEMREPAKTAPRAMVGGTLAVLALYLLLNAGFLLSTPAEAMAGKNEVGLIFAGHVFGERGGAAVGALIAVGLVSLISAMTWAGPRVAGSMGEDHRPLAFLAWRNRAGVPVAAILCQSALAAGFLLWVSADGLRALIRYLEFLLNLSLAAAVFGVFWLRLRRPELERPYRCFGYPLTPTLFLGAAGYVNWHFFRHHLAEAVFGLATLAVGGLVWLASRFWFERTAAET